MIIGCGRWRLGRWWFYLDTGYLSVGRTTVGDESVVYSVLGLVAEHHRPIGYAARLLDANHERLVRRWQRVAAAMWRHTEWLYPLRDGESLPQWAQRRWRQTVVMYEARAATERALDRAVPTIDQLTEWAPGTFGIPTVAHNAS